MIAKSSTLFANLYNIKAGKMKLILWTVQRSIFVTTPKYRNFTLDHAWQVLRKYLKWDVAEPVDPNNLTELFGPDVRPRPARKPRQEKSQISGDVEHRG